MATRIRVEFRLLGSDLDHETITSALGVKSTTTWRAGDSIGESRLKRDTDAWVLSMPMREELDLGNAVTELLHVVAPLAHALEKLRDSFTIEPLISCAVYMEDATPSVYLSSDQLRTIGSLGAALDIDLIQSASS